MNPLTVLHIDFEKTWRGGQQQLFWLVEGLNRSGDKNFVLCRPGSALSARLKENGAVWFAVRPLFELDLIAAYKTAGLINTLKPDVIHLHSAHAHTIGIMAAKISRHKAKVVVSRRVDFPIKNRCKYHWADRIIAISNGVKNVLLSDGIPEEKISVVHSGVDLNRFDKVEGSYLYRELGIQKGQPVVGIVAALAPHKDHRNFLKAARLVKKEIPDSVFAIVGAGRLKKDLTDFADSLGLSGSTIFTGFRNDVPELLSIFSLFVLSSYLEGLGTSLVDAMASGLPIVATNVGGIPEVVADGLNGYIVPPRDHQRLAEKIIRILKDEDLKKKFSARSKLLSRNFSKEKMTEGTKRVYLEIV